MYLMKKNSDLVISLKSSIRRYLPSIILELLENKIWVGAYSKWSDAMILCEGYDNRKILEKCKKAALEVINGNAVYERDSVLFDEIQYSWGLLAGLQYAAICTNNRLNVIDFGGSFGSTYHQNFNFLKQLNHVNWTIVEQNNFVECGNKLFKSAQLNFCTSISEVDNISEFNVLVLSGVLQYLESPRDMIDELVAYEFPFILIDRTGFTSHPTRDILTIQKVPAEIYEATYPCWFLAQNFIDRILLDYEKIGEFSSPFEPTILNLENGEIGTWNGYIFKRRDLCQN